MRDTIMVIAAFISPLACVVGAVYLAAHGIEGWGWFLFVGLLIGGSVRFGDKSGGAS